MPDQADRFRCEKYLSHAQGWLALGKLDEAANALEEIPFTYQLTVPVLATRCECSLAAQQWDVAASYAKQLIEAEPNKPGFWIHFAYATRRAESIAAAEKILLEVKAKFPDCALIHFNLACYAAQQGQFAEVAGYLERASRLDADCKEAALKDPDLEPYWKSLNPSREG